MFYDELRRKCISTEHFTQTQKNTLSSQFLVKDFLEFNVKKYTTYPNLWDRMKAVLKENIIAISADI